MFKNNFLCKSTDDSLPPMQPPPLIHAPLARQHTAADGGEIIWSKNHGYCCIKQVLNGNRNKVGTLRVSDIENKIVAFTEFCNLVFKKKTIVLQRIY